MLEKDKDRDALFEQELQDALNKLDRWFPPQTPSLASFEKLVEATRKERRRGLIRDLAIFWLIGMTAISIGLFSLMESPAVYIAAQLCVMLGFPLVLAIKGRKRADSI